MKNFTSTLILLFISFNFSFAGSSQLLQKLSEDSIKTNTAEQDSTSYLFVSGKLVNEKGKPQHRESVMLLFGENGSIKIDSTGHLLNPSGKTDENGNFHFKIDKSLLREFKYTFSLSVASTMIVNDKGVPIVVTIDPETKKVDLGEIILK